MKEGAPAQKKKKSEAFPPRSVSPIEKRINPKEKIEADRALRNEYSGMNVLREEVLAYLHAHSGARGVRAREILDAVRKNLGEEKAHLEASDNPNEQARYAKVQNALDYLRFFDTDWKPAARTYKRGTHQEPTNTFDETVLKKRLLRHNEGRVVETKQWRIRIDSPLREVEELLKEQKKEAKQNRPVSIKQQPEEVPPIQKEHVLSSQERDAELENGIVEAIEAKDFSKRNERMALTIGRGAVGSIRELHKNDPRFEKVDWNALEVFFFETARAAGEDFRKVFTQNKGVETLAQNAAEKNKHAYEEETQERNYERLRALDPLLRAMCNGVVPEDLVIEFSMRIANATWLIGKVHRELFKKLDAAKDGKEIDAVANLRNIENVAPWDVVLARFYEKGKAVYAEYEAAGEVLGTSEEWGTIRAAFEAYKDMWELQEGMVGKEGIAGIARTASEVTFADVFSVIQKARGENPALPKHADEILAKVVKYNDDPEKKKDNPDYFFTKDGVTPRGVIRGTTPIDIALLKKGTSSGLGFNAVNELRDTAEMIRQAPGLTQEQQEQVARRQEALEEQAKESMMHLVSFGEKELSIVEQIIGAKHSENDREDFETALLLTTNDYLEANFVEDTFSSPEAREGLVERVMHLAVDTCIQNAIGGESPDTFLHRNVLNEYVRAYLKNAFLKNASDPEHSLYVEPAPPMVVYNTLKETFRVLPTALAHLTREEVAKRLKPAKNIREEVLRKFEQSRVQVAMQAQSLRAYLTSE